MEYVIEALGTEITYRTDEVVDVRVVDATTVVVDLPDGSTDIWPDMTRWFLRDPEAGVCGVHPDYGVLRAPTADCSACRQAWAEKVALP